ncbi:DHA2 family multidrug resistance protein [Sphingobium sp. B2D3A]|uniref:DHA2 family efflux MFS transporter permease subunit n=1 Tax=unclassified Sphingobium TaxID=2611147 RepID=UPI0022247ADD|nr:MULTISPECIES: DHA2 family efflux MFS transporter permease subunit [unclassified Sphingobium]MCW2338071.1 DHA2 family multidrug resistance protein [Sphingobium sp. B2D3A]MCW2384530.1 DHA2 family multidrug resistance protein [Sphingobium sp. B2D3D]
MAPTSDLPQLQVRHKALLTMAIMSAMIMQVLDTTITNVALPHMRASLGASDETISWVLTSYILAAAIAIPITGWLADRIGTRRLLLISVFVFVVASVLCGIAQSLTEMVLFRALQGVGGAFVGPLAQSLMLDINRPSQHAKAMSVYGMGVMIGPIMGPVVGGWLTEWIDWRWCFFVNVPFGIVCLVGLYALLPEKPLQRRNFDLFGFALIALGLASLQLMLDRGQHADWFSSTEIWVEAALAVSGLWMFAVHTLTARKPLFAPALFADRNFLSAAAFMFIIGLVMFAAMALLPPLLQGLYGYSVVDTGWILATRGAGLLVAMALSSRLTSLIDPRVLIAGGFSVTASSLWMMTGWSMEQNWVPFVVTGVVQGAGIGIVFVPLQMLAFGTLPPGARTEGAAVLNLTRNIGSSIGIAVVMALLARNSQVSHADLTQHISSANLPVDPSELQRFGSFGTTVLATIDGIVNQQATMIAFLDDFYAMAIVSTLIIPAAFFLRKPKRGPGSPPPPPISE